MSDPRGEAIDVPIDALRGLQDAARRVSRSLGEADVAAELAKQVARLAGADLVEVLRVSLERSEAATLSRRLLDRELVRPPVRVATGITLEAARSGRRVGGRGAVAAESLGPDGILVGTLAFAVAVPMLMSLHLEGVLVAAWRDEPPPGAEDVLEALAAHGTLALRNARLYAESERERRVSEALGAAAAAVGASLRVADVQRLILRNVQGLLGADGATLSLVDDRYMQIVSAVGSAEVLTGRLVPLDGSLEGEVYRTRLPRLVNDVADAVGLHRPTARAVHLRRVVGVPLGTAQGVLGVVCALDRDEPFTDEDVRWLQRLADQCAVAIHNARHFEEVEAATRQWRHLFDALPVGVVLLDERGAIRRCNARAAAYVGADDPDAPLGLGFGAVLHGAPGASPPAPVVEALARGVTTRGLVSARDVVYDLRVSPHPGGGVVGTFEVAAEAALPGAP